MKRLTPLFAVGLLGALGACSSDEGGVDPDTVTGVPASWLDDTAKAWPDAASFGRSTPTLSRGACLLGDEPPEVLDAQAKYTDQGFGGFGDDLSATDSYRYLCSLWARDHYAGELQLLKVADDATGRKVMAEFDAQTSTSVQDNTVSHETSGRLEVSVLTRWYPTNPQGMYRAQYYDEQQGAIATMEINSLDKADFDAFSAQKMADTLVETMAAG
ncbi:hypothetical protein GCM10023221_27720 [Luteimicrobium xylanilyticum]|uniref:Uncharacterized protein n=1 Tax=Luteimicrobium xylanilyticum TaxID=1133546 RepID=A0A5P9QAU8_9MICO|nr:hypothetical protein [Luteimicrobium xylanilyticum]QFU98557.1 hypothetical protein KDY119_02073 [Luteimicrobium xylanilyticum]